MLNLKKHKDSGIPGIGPVIAADPHEVPMLDWRDFVPPEARCAGGEQFVLNEKDGSLLLLVPGGEFQAGGSGSDEGGGPFPVTLPGFYLGLTSVTNQQYQQFMEATSHRKPDNSYYEQKPNQGYRQMLWMAA